jgi:hypothetical protein
MENTILSGKGNREKQKKPFISTTGVSSGRAALRPGLEAR